MRLDLSAEMLPWRVLQHGLNRLDKESVLRGLGKQDAENPDDGGKNSSKDK